MERQQFMWLRWFALRQYHTITKILLVVCHIVCRQGIGVRSCLHIHMYIQIKILFECNRRVSLGNILYLRVEISINLLNLKLLPLRHFNLPCNVCVRLCVSKSPEISILYIYIYVPNVWIYFQLKLISEWTNKSSRTVSLQTIIHVGRCTICT